LYILISRRSFHFSRCCFSVDDPLVKLEPEISNEVRRFLEKLGHDVVHYMYKDETSSSSYNKGHDKAQTRNADQSPPDWHVNRKQFGRLHVVAKEVLWNPRHRCPSKQVRVISYSYIRMNLR
jgi:hypothetical protein